MRQELKALYDLQVIDNQMAAAKKALAALDYGASLKQGMTQTQTILDKRTATLQASETEFKDNDLKLKSCETKKKDFEKRLYDGKVTSPKELTGIQQEIEMLKKNCRTYDERILELYDIIEQQKKSVAEADERLGQFKSRYEQVASQQKAKSQALQAEISRLTTEREELVKTIPEQPLKRYESIRARAGGVGIALVEDNRCGACHTSLTAYIQRVLREDKEYQFCESCGRFLYLAGK